MIPLSETSTTHAKEWDCTINAQQPHKRLAVAARWCGFLGHLLTACQMLSKKRSGADSSSDGTARVNEHFCFFSSFWCDFH